MFIYLLRIFAAVLIVPNIAFAAECPSVKSHKSGFVLSHSGVQSEFKTSGPVVSVQHGFADGGKQKAFLYQGLIEIFRSGNDGNYNQYFTSNLNDFWPLRVGARRTFEFIPLDADAFKEKWTLDLAVTKRRAFLSVIAVMTFSTSFTTSEETVRKLNAGRRFMRRICLQRLQRSTTKVPVTKKP